VKIIIGKVIIAAVMLTAVLGLGVQPSRAGSYGDSKWCAVSNDGDRLSWDCEYDTVDDCSPAILVGNRGYCTINPYWRPPDPSTNSQR
jgi:hypothetical protein